MSDNINLNEIWNKQAVPMPDAKDIFARANRYKRRHLLKLLVTNCLLVLTTAYVTWIIIRYEPALLTTRIGALLVILAMVMYLVAYNGLIPLLLKANNNTNVNVYLQDLIRLNAKQKFLQTTMMHVYFILLSSGICLYLLEFTLRMSLVWGVLTYTLTLVWIAIGWFYFRVRTIKKQEKAMNELIERFESYCKQLQE